MSRGRWVRQIAVALPFLLLGLLFLSPRTASWGRNAFDRAATPIIGIVHALGSGSSAAAEAIRSRIFFSAAERQFEAEREALAVERSEFETLRRENQDLRSALGLRARIGRAVAYADVIGSFNEGRDEYLILSVPTGADFLEGAAVFSPSGSFVGILRTVAEVSASVRLVSSPSETMTVKILPSGIEAISTGDNNDEMILSLVPENAEINIGDPVVTAGRNAGIPPETLVGTVVSIERHTTDAFLGVRVKSAAAFRRLDQVTVSAR